MKTKHILLLSLGLNVLLAGAGGIFLYWSATSSAPTLSALPSNPLHTTTSSVDSVGKSHSKLRDYVRQNILNQTAVHQQQQFSSSIATSTTARPQDLQWAFPLNPSKSVPAVASQNTMPGPVGAPNSTSGSAGGVVSGGTGSHGDNPAIGGAVAPTMQATAAHAGNAASSQVLLPAALAPDNPAIPITTDQQVVAWEQIQDDFIEDVGGKAPNPKDSTSVANWKAAQQYSDDVFKAKFGTEAFLLQNIAAYRQGVSK